MFIYIIYIMCVCVCVYAGHKSNMTPHPELMWVCSTFLQTCTKTVWYFLYLSPKVKQIGKQKLQ